MDAKLVVQQQTRLEQLENEITRLKKLNTRPNLKPNTKPPEDNDQGGARLDLMKMTATTTLKATPETTTSGK